MKHILVNDFFDDPDRLRQTALSLDGWRVMEDSSGFGFGFKFRFGNRKAEVWLLFLVFFHKLRPYI